MTARTKPDVADLIRRLKQHDGHLGCLVDEAAGGLESLQAELAKARDVIRPFAEIADNYADQEDDDFDVLYDFDVLGRRLKLRLFRAARAFQGEKQDGRRDI